jgi:hypothetical protein
MMKLNAKHLLQKAWVFEVIWLLLNFQICLYFFPAKVGPFMQALPLLTTLIGGQGILAAAGPEVKRFIESKSKEGK